MCVCDPVLQLDAQRRSDLEGGAPVHAVLDHGQPGHLGVVHMRQRQVALVLAVQRPALGGSLAAPHRLGNLRARGRLTPRL